MPASQQPATRSPRSSRPAARTALAKEPRKPATAALATVSTATAAMSTTRAAPAEPHDDAPPAQRQRVQASNDQPPPAAIAAIAAAIAAAAGDTERQGQHACAILEGLWAALPLRARVQLRDHAYGLFTGHAAGGAEDSMDPHELEEVSPLPQQLTGRLGQKLELGGAGKPRPDGHRHAGLGRTSRGQYRAAADREGAARCW